MVDDHRAFARIVVKHLPPSGSTLRLLDLSGTLGETLIEIRGDLQVQPEERISEESTDAAVAVNLPLNPELLKQTLARLRPGGRFIFVSSTGQPGPQWAELLEGSGYTRILVEAAFEGGGVLARGEKPHTVQPTLDRVRQVANRDKAAEFQHYRGRYVHLLIRQTPHKPAWALKPGETVTWQAVAVERADTPVLLAFSGLPRAVAFMQPAIMAGVISDIHKVARFRREIVSAWDTGVMLNPEPTDVGQDKIVLIEVDLTSAEAPDE